MSAGPAPQVTASDPPAILLRVVIRAFIPKGTTDPAGRPCFITDERGFSSSPDGPGVSSRATMEFLLVVERTTAKFGKVNERDVFRVAEGRGPDCQARQETARGAASATIDALVYRDGIAQVDFAVPKIAPYDIEYGGTITFDTVSSTVRFRGEVGAFPAYEALVEDAHGGITTLFQLPAAVGKTRPVDVTVGLSAERNK